MGDFNAHNECWEDRKSDNKGKQVNNIEYQYYQVYECRANLDFA